MNVVVCGALVLADVVTSKPDIIELQVLNEVYQYVGLPEWLQQLRRLTFTPATLGWALEWLRSRGLTVDDRRVTRRDNDTGEYFRARNIFYFPPNNTAFFSPDRSHVHILLRYSQDNSRLAFEAAVCTQRFGNPPVGNPRRTLARQAHAFLSPDWQGSQLVDRYRDLVMYQDARQELPSYNPFTNLQFNEPSYIRQLQYMMDQFGGFLEELGLPDRWPTIPPYLRDGSSLPILRPAPSPAPGDGHDEL